MKENAIKALEEKLEHQKRHNKIYPSIRGYGIEVDLELAIKTIKEMKED